MLEVLGKRLEYLGPAGSGSVMKLVSNHIAGITTWAVAEGIALAAASGVPALEAMDVLGGTVAASYVLADDVQPRVASGDFEPGFSVDLYHKDLRLAAKLAQGLRVPLMFNQLAMEMFQLMRAPRSRRQVADGLRQLSGRAGPRGYPRSPEPGGAGTKRRRKGLRKSGWRTPALARS